MGKISNPRTAFRGSAAFLRYGLLAMGVAMGAGASAWAGTARAAGGEPAPQQLDDKKDTCGKSGLPDCPLQAWMKANIVAPKAAGDNTKLAANLKKIVDLNPDAKEFPLWEGFAKAGAAAAEKGDKDALNGACNDCHNKYRKPYREKYRDKAV